MLDKLDAQTVVRALASQGLRDAPEEESKGAVTATYVQSPMTGTWHVQATFNEHWISITRCGRHFLAIVTQDDEPTTTHCAECWQAKWRDIHPLAEETWDD